MTNIVETKTLHGFNKIKSNLPDSTTNNTFSILDVTYGKKKQNLVVKGIRVGSGLDVDITPTPNIHPDSNIVTIKLDPNPNPLSTPYVLKAGSQMTGDLSFTNSSGARIRAGHNNASSPSYSFLSSPTTGMFRPLNDQIGFSTAGVERFRIDNNGNLISYSTGGLKLPDGNIAERPSSPVNGYIRYNNQTNSVESYVAGNWANLISVANTPSVGDVVTWNGTQPVWQKTTQTYVVPNIAARNALTPIVGDLCYVNNSFDGEWALFICVNISPVQWVEVANLDSTQSDSKTRQVLINFSDTSPVTISNISNNTRVSWVLVEVLVPFNGTSPTLTVGDDGLPNRLLTSGDVDLTTAGVYVTNPTHYYTGLTSDLDIRAYFNFGGSTAGQATVTISWI